MKNGPYVLVVPPHDYPGARYRGRYAYEHHVVWWQKSGEAVPAGKVVHHINHVKTDNSPENLTLIDWAEHSRGHHLGVKHPPRIGKPSRRGKGHATGEIHGRSKLTEDLVRQIRAAHLAGRSASGLAKEHGMHSSTIQALLQRKTWQHVA